MLENSSIANQKLRKGVGRLTNFVGVALGPKGLGVPPDPKGLGVALGPKGFGVAPGLKGLGVALVPKELVSEMRIFRVLVKI
jgi:hypothetical protein